MNGFTKIFLLACVVALASAEDKEGRKGKNLLSVFPFNNGRNNQNHAHHHDHEHGHDGHHAHAHVAPTSRDSRQGAGDDVELSIGNIAAAGERCVEKVVMEKHTEYDDIITCKHSYDEKCHTTYTTDYEPQQEEECEETFTKSCFIEYKKVASEEQVKFCHTPLGCDGEGPPEEKTVYESQCTTSYHKHDVVDDVVDCKTIQEEKCQAVSQGYTTEQKCHKWPKVVCSGPTPTNVIKTTPQTQCTKVPRVITVAGACTPVPLAEECFDKTETVVQEVPEETCNLEPQKSCKFVTKLVPLLKPAEECVDIPKEVCSRTRVPRADKVLKPVVKKWCYVPTEESGLGK